MHSLPFRLLVVNDLDLQVTVRSDRCSSQLPGVVEESTSQPRWKSKPNIPYPQELGLILLTTLPATIKSLRVTVERARTPAQTLPSRQAARHALNPLDAVSRYLSAEWNQCGEPLEWEASLSDSLATSRDIDCSVVRLHVSKCEFIKLVVHAPFESPRNLPYQVVLEEIELFGSTKDKADDELTTHRVSIIHRPALLPLANDNDELQAVLLDAGVPMDLIAQVTSISTTEAEMLLPCQQKCKPRLVDAVGLTSESNSCANKSGSISRTTTLVTGENNQERDSTSPFDSVLRQYVEQTARERSILENFLATTISQATDEISSWQSPTISPTDPANSNEITLYTFGTFFTQCLLCGGADIQVTCLQMAERTAPVTKKAIGASAAFEGIIALIVLGVREAKTSQVFQTAIHLASTVFLTEIATMKTAPDIVESERAVSELRLIEEIACANWSYGLRVILEWTLASPLCWSINRTRQSTPSTKSLHILKGLSRVSKAPPSIDRYFLQFIRLLVDQELTRTNFFDELLDLTPRRNQAGFTFAQNRLRLLRLVLRNDISRCQVPANVKMHIRTFCTSLLSLKEDQMLLERDDNDVLARLASECLSQVERPVSSGHQNFNRTSLTYVHRHLEASSTAQRYSHTALFIQDPLLEVEAAVFTAQLQQYLSSQPRPSGLYRHSFVRASKTEFINAETREIFQKGNIAFQGHVVPRSIPKETFQEEMERNLAPFVFDIVPNKSMTGVSLLSTSHQNVVSNFAAFAGIIERRTDPPKRSNKVFPQQLKEYSPVKDIATTSTKYTQPVTKNPAKSIPDFVITNQGPATPPEVTIQLSATTPSVNSPSVSIPVASEQKIKQTEDANATNPHDRSKTVAKGKGKEKGGKKGGKDSENCVLQ